MSQPRRKSTDDIVPEDAPPRDAHPARGDLADPRAIADAEEAAKGEAVAANEDLPPAARAKKLRKLPDDELIALAEEARRADHWLDVARRTQAEMDNALKRARRDTEESLRFSASPLARDLLPVLDNLGRALAAGEAESGALADGVRMTLKLFVDALAKHGIEPIPAVGKVFDPAMHEAVMAGNDPDQPDNAITQEFEQGWTLNGRVLRASKVKVNKRG
jgi:molecular chaperone GrpE